MMDKFLIGTTIELSWVSSASTPTDIYAAVYDGTETMVSSMTLSSSGNGHYYVDYTVPTSTGYYVVEYTATISSKPYKKRKRFQTVRTETD